VLPRRPIGQEITKVVPIEHPLNPHFCQTGRADLRLLQRHLMLTRATCIGRSWNCTDIWPTRSGNESNECFRRHCGGLFDCVGHSIDVLVRSKPAATKMKRPFRKVIVEMTDGFHNHDGKAAARMYTGDARFVSVPR